MQRVFISEAMYYFLIFDCSYLANYLNDIINNTLKEDGYVIVVSDNDVKPLFLLKMVKGYRKQFPIG